MRSEGGGENQGRTDRVIKKVKQEQWTEMGWRPVGLRYLVGVCVCVRLCTCVCTQVQVLSGTLESQFVLMANCLPVAVNKEPIDSVTHRSFLSSPQASALCFSPPPQHTHIFKFP